MMSEHQASIHVYVAYLEGSPDKQIAAALAVSDSQAVLAATAIDVLCPTSYVGENGWRAGILDPRNRGAEGDALRWMGDQVKVVGLNSVPRDKVRRFLGSALTENVLGTRPTVTLPPL